MNNVTQMRFAMAIHMLQRSNPATRQALESKRSNNLHVRVWGARTRPPTLT